MSLLLLSLVSSVTDKVVDARSVVDPADASVEDDCSVAESVVDSPSVVRSVEECVDVIISEVDELPLSVVVPADESVVDGESDVDSEFVDVSIVDVSRVDVSNVDESVVDVSNVDESVVDVSNVDVSMDV